MPLNTLTEAEMIEYIRALIRGNATDPNLSKYSDWDIQARLMAKLFAGNQEQAAYILRQFSPVTCDDGFLDDLGDGRGVYRYEAEFYDGGVVFGGTAGTLIPSGTSFTTPDGRVFVSTEDVTCSLPAWSGLTMGEYSQRQRLTVSPSPSAMAIGDTCVPGSGHDDIHVIKGLVTGAPVVDFYRPINRDAVVGEAFNPISAAVVSVQALEVGSVYSLEAWDNISLTTPIANIESDGVVLDMTGGGDDESHDEYRARLIAFDRARPGSGNKGAYLHWALGTPGVRVGKAFVFPNVISPGVVTIVCFGVAGSRGLSDGDVERIRLHVESLAPSTDVLDIRSGDFTTKTTVAAVVSCGKNYEPDWGPTKDNPTAPATYAISSSTTTTVTLSTTPAVDAIEDADRILMTTLLGTRYSTVQRNVTSVVGAVVTFEPAVEIAPAGSIYSGGPVAEPLIAAIEKAFDDLGPGVGDDSLIREPEPSVESPDNMTLAQLYATFISVDGVSNVALALPSADAEPAPLASLAIGQLTLALV